MSTAYKPYLLIDHENDRHVFITNIADSEAWFVQNNVNMANIPTDSNGVPTTLELINLVTGASVPIRLVIRAAELQIIA
jgi:hypothetical protein